MTAGLHHAPVLLHETLALLAPRDGGLYADTTLGSAGHAEAILEASSPTGRLIGIDRDPRAVARARETLASFGDRAEIFHGEMGQVGGILARAGVDRVDGLVADLGISSVQLDDPERGFSFAHSGPIDMRMDTSCGETAAELIDRLGAEDLANLIHALGEERRSRAIARSIKRAAEAGELATTEDLRHAVVRAVGPRRGRIDPATRTFQALRIAVNDELEQLSALVQGLADVLVDGGVAAVISFHSLEDRIVKHGFRGDPHLEPLTKRPLRATEGERVENPRSRSAKLRAARRRPRAHPAEDGE